jgi:hypothetical protein
MSYMARPLVVGALLMALTLTPLASIASPAASSGVDLGIADDQLLERPAIRVAWRNSQEILQVEVAIRNGGDQVGHGKLYLELPTKPVMGGP